MKTPKFNARTLLHIAAGVVTLLMIAVLVRALRRDGPAALEAWRSARVQWPWIVASVAFALAGHAFYVFGWQRLVRDAGERAPFFQLVRLFLVSNLGRYLPAGKAWQMAIVAMMAAERRLPSAILAATSLFQGMVGVGVGAIVLFAAGGATLGLPGYFLILPILGVIGLLVLPAILHRLPPQVHDLIKKRVHGIDTVTAGTMWTLIWTSVASWILWGVALDSLGRGLSIASGTPLTAYITAWTGSFLGGLIAFFAPAGLGAREEIMQVVLARSGMAAANVLILVVVTRAWVTLLDVIPAGIVLLLRRWRPRASTDTVIPVTPTSLREE